jgi:hypothetical protein
VWFNLEVCQSKQKELLNSINLIIVSGCEGRSGMVVVPSNGAIVGGVGPNANFS